MWNYTCQAIQIRSAFQIKGGGVGGGGQETQKPSYSKFVRNQVFNWFTLIPNV